MKKLIFVIVLFSMSCDSSNEFVHPEPTTPKNPAPPGPPVCESNYEWQVTHMLKDRWFLSGSPQVPVWTEEYIPYASTPQNAYLLNITHSWHEWRFEVNLWDIWGIFDEKKKFKGRIKVEKYYGDNNAYQHIDYMKNDSWYSSPLFPIIVPIDWTEDCATGRDETPIADFALLYDDANTSFDYITLKITVEKDPSASGNNGGLKYPSSDVGKVFYIKVPNKGKL